MGNLDSTARPAYIRSRSFSCLLKPVDYDQFVAAALQLSLYWMVLNAPPTGKEI